jgi:hypothetical protein
VLAEGRIEKRTTLDGVMQFKAAIHKNKKVEPLGSRSQAAFAFSRHSGRRALQSFLHLDI